MVVPNPMWLASLDEGGDTATGRMLCEDEDKDGATSLKAKEGRKDCQQTTSS